jgi:aryl-alcohol dehydrogenase-like predicted oxidoreductase
VEEYVINVNSPRIEKRRLGKTDLLVTPIGLGCWQFGGRGRSTSAVWKSPPQEEIDNIVKAALDGGINWFDTAQAYGMGASERALATALCKADMANRDVIIATKWFLFFRTARNILSSIDERIGCLSPCKIDLYQIHVPYSFSSVEAQMNAMAALVKAGKVRYIGVSNFSAKQMRRAHAALAEHGLPLASNQVQFNLINRKLEKNVLPAARELNVSLIAYSPLAQGLLTGKFHKNPDLLRNVPFLRRMSMRRTIEKTRALVKTLKDIAVAHNCTASEVALSWAVNFHGDIIVAIPGATKLEHVRQNVGALTLKLSPEEMAKLDEQSRLISK